MKVMETVGMMSTGALVMLAGIYVLDVVRQPRVAPAVEAQAAPVAATKAEVAAQQQSAVAEVSVSNASPAVQPVAAPTPAPAAVEVTRTRSDLTGSASIGQLESFVALSMQPVSNDTPLTQEQQEIISYFERTARDLNTASEGYTGDYVAFNDMAINRLEIRHFYTVRQNLDEVPVDTLMASQTDLVQANLCEEPMMRTLIEEHGFRFTYTYVSQDNRFLGNVRGDIQACNL